MFKGKKEGYGKKSTGYGDRNDRSDRKDSYGGKSYGENRGKSYSDKPYGEKRGSSFGDKSYGEKRGSSFGDKSYGEKRGSSFGDKSYGEKRGSSFGNKPYGEKKSSYGDRNKFKNDSSSEKSYSPLEKKTSTKPVSSSSYTSDDIEKREDIVAGRNPVIELLSTKTPIDNIYIQKTDSKSGAIIKILNMAREKDLVVKEVTKEKLDSLSDGVAHQGVVAVVAANSFATLEEIIEKGKDKPLFVIVCDEIEDPHNLGAIVRTADAVGADGVIIPSRRGVGLTGSVMKASAGAARHIPIAKVSNITTALKELKEAGAWVYAADMDGECYSTVNFDGSVALVIGSEGRGVSRLVKENCDVIVSMPMNGKVNSLNASVAAGVLMYEVVRQRAVKKI